MSTRTPKKRRNQILEVAAEYFSRHGYAGTSMRSLAQEIGISAPAIYRHFSSKLALFESVIGDRQNGEETREYLETLREHEDIGEVLRAVSIHLLVTAKKRPEVLRLLLFTSLTEDPAAGRLLSEFRAPYVDFLNTELQRRIDAGTIMPVDPGITSRCYVGMVMGCALNAQMWNCLEGVCYEMLDIVDNNVPIFARGLRVDGDSRPSQTKHDDVHTPLGVD